MSTFNPTYQAWGELLRTERNFLRLEPCFFIVLTELSFRYLSDEYDYIIYCHEMF